MRDAPLARRLLAGMSRDGIASLGCDELVYALRSVEPPFLDDATMHRLDALDRPTLQRLVYLAQRCCRNLGYGRPAQ